MPQRRVLMSIVLVMLLGVAALLGQPVVVAQEATPSAATETEPEGVTFEPVAIASGLAIPAPLDLIAAYMTLEPGAVLPLEESDPTGGMVIVESGAFTVGLNAPWSVSRSGELASAIATAEATGEFMPSDEQIASGEEVIMEVGDAAYIPGGVSGEIRNDGDETAEAIVVLVGPTEAMTGGSE